MSNLEQARIFAQAGARVLDSIEFFKGWREKIYVPELALNDPYSCVLGQIGTAYGVEADFTEGHAPYDKVVAYIQQVVDGSFEPEETGFDANPTSVVSYDDLQQAWLELLEQEPNTTP